MSSVRRVHVRPYGHDAHALYVRDVRVLYVHDVHVPCALCDHGGRARAHPCGHGCYVPRVRDDRSARRVPAYRKNMFKKNRT